MAITNPNSIFAGTSPDQKLPNVFTPTAPALLNPLDDKTPRPLGKAFSPKPGDAQPTSQIARTLQGSSDQDQAPVLQRVNLSGQSAPVSTVVPDRPQGQIAKLLSTPPPDQQHLDALYANRQKLSDTDARPWGFAGAAPSAEHPNGLAPNHPGHLGKVLHMLSTAGQIAGDIVAPNIMAEIPGTHLNRLVQEHGDTSEINHEQQLMSENRERDAGTAATQLANANEPQKARDTHDLTQSTIGKNNAEAQPKPENLTTAYAHRVSQVLAQGGDPSKDVLTQHLADALTAIQPGTNKPGTLHYETVTGPDKKPHTYGLNDKGEKVVDEGEHFEKPVQGPAITMVVPDGNGGGTVERLRPGQSVAPGAVSATQFGSMNTPTSSTRTMIESAPGVIDLANRVKSLVAEQQKSLGPAASRWNEFMAGKVGAPNPEFTKLRTDVGLLQTKLMRMHVGARGGEQMMQHFQGLIDSSKQSPENMNAALDEIIDYANEVQGEGHPHSGGAGHSAPTGGSGAPPAGAKVRDFTSFGGGK